MISHVTAPKADIGGNSLVIMEPIQIQQLQLQLLPSEEHIVYHP